MFVDAFAKSVPVPTDADQSVTIRKLSWAELQESLAVARDRYMALVGGLSGMRELVAQQRKEKPEAEEPARTPEDKAAIEFDTHDIPTLLKYGITAWTYKRPVTPEAIALIEDGCAGYLAREIFNLTKGLGAESKNG